MDTFDIFVYGLRGIIFLLPIYGNYKIYKNNSIMTKSIKVKLPPKINETHRNFKINNKFNVEYIDSIDKFYKVLKKRLPDNYLNTFRDNIETCKIQKKSSKYIYGSYFPFINKLIFSDKSVISHELLHLSSNVVKNMTTYTGFSQYSLLGIKIGDGLNEGYTTLLDKRYFNVNYTYIYPLESTMADMLESIIGKNIMEKYYFTGNLYEIIEELKKYDSEKEILLFIRKLDYINKNKYIKLERKKCQRYINENILFLLKCHILKWKNSIRYPMTDEYYNNIANYINNLIDDIIKKKYLEYKLVDLLDIYRLVDKMLNNSKVNDIIDSGQMDDRYLYKDHEPYKITYKIKK